MRKWLLVLLIVFLLPVANARIMNIDYVKAYVNDNRADDIDKSGGDMEAMPGDTLKFTTRIINIEDGTIEARLRLTIYDIDNGDDIDKDSGWYSIDKNDEKTKSVSITVPSNADEDDYEVRLKVYARNENETEDEIDYTLTIDYGGQAYVENKMAEQITNVTIELVEISKACLDRMNSSINFAESYSVCEGGKKYAEAEAKIYKKNYNDTEQELTECETNLKNANERNTRLDAQLDNSIPIYQCTNTTARQIDAATSKQMTNFLLWGGLAALVYFGWVKPRREKAMESPAKREPLRTV